MVAFQNAYDWRMEAVRDSSIIRRAMIEIFRKGVADRFEPTTAGVTIDNSVALCSNVTTYGPQQPSLWRSSASAVQGYMTRFDGIKRAVCIAVKFKQNGSQLIVNGSV